MNKALYSKINEKGQITIPYGIRSKMGLVQGSRVELLNKGGYIVIRPLNKSITDLKGFLPKPSITLSCEEMDKIIQDVK